MAKATTTARKAKAKAPARRVKTSARPADNMTVWKGIVTRAWKDREFRDRLLEDPHPILAEHGFKAKRGKSYRVVADSKNTKYLILPESARSVRVKPVRGGEPDPGF